MRPSLLAGTSLLALAASLATASATPVPFSDTTVGSTTFTAPSAGTYDITAIGAQGGQGGDEGGAGGLGEQVSGDFALAMGEMLTIAVGGAGASGAAVNGGGGGGGGGGSFVVGPSNAPLVIGGGVFGFFAGGGGNADAATSGSAGSGAAGAGGMNGQGGGGASGGGGFDTAGSNGSGYRPGSGGGAFSGLLGGAAGFGPGTGGFGGGGGGSGGGGCSFDAGANPLFSLAMAGGNGSVVITEVTPTPRLPSPSQPASPCSAPPCSASAWPGGVGAARGTERRKIHGLRRARGGTVSGRMTLISNRSVARARRRSRLPPPSSWPSPHVIRRPGMTRTAQRPN